jgi:hypothetical protein
MTNNPLPAAGDPWFSQTVKWSDFQPQWLSIYPQTVSATYDSEGNYRITLLLFNQLEQSQAESYIGHGIFAWASGLVSLIFLDGVHCDLSLTFAYYTHVVRWSVSKKKNFPFLNLLKANCFFKKKHVRPVNRTDDRHRIPRRHQHRHQLRRRI